MLAQLKAFEAREPEIVFEWNDLPTGAKGWIVINSLRGGAAGGGTRMRIGLDKHEVTSLAKTMEIKFAVAGPAIGGAKSGINFDPTDPRKDEVLRRWYKAILPILKTYYGTGGDLNIDEIHEVIPITKEYGLEHPQEGVFVGHFHPTKEGKAVVINQLQVGVSKVLDDANYSPEVSRKFVVADMITGWGVSEGVRHYYQHHKNINLEGKTAIIQGWGNVSAAAAYYLAKNGVKIKGIIDRNGGLIKEEGFTFEEIRQLFLDKGKENALVAKDMIPFAEINQSIWEIGADIFIPGAASRLVTMDQLEKMLSFGLEVISCGANVPFADIDIFYGAISAYADKHCVVIPDFIANCGMARTFAYLMQPSVEMTDKAIFEDASNIIGNAIKEINDLAPHQSNLWMERGYKIVLEKLGV
jgi:glutamate dehydrogenase/leucine dehydrogenase